MPGAVLGCCHSVTMPHAFTSRPFGRSFSCSRAAGCPKALGRGVGLEPDQVPGTDAGVAQARQVQCLRRSGDGPCPSSGRGLPQGRAEQAPLDDRGLRLQQFGQALAGQPLPGNRASRPAQPVGSSGASGEPG